MSEHKEVVENEIFNLLRQKNVLLQTPGCEEKVKLVDLSIARLQQAHPDVTYGMHHEGEKPMELEQLEKSEDTEIQDVCERMESLFAEAVAALLKRRDAQYRMAVADLEKEKETLFQENASLEEAAGTLAEVVAARVRVGRTESDALLVAGRVAEAHRKLQETEEAQATPARTKTRQKEIGERLSAIEAAKKEALQSAAVAFRESSIALIRGTESGLAGLLDGVRDSLNTLEMQVGPLYQPAQLTADEGSPEWRTLNRLYRGRG
jgi:hypothetical protein